MKYALLQQLLVLIMMLVSLQSFASEGKALPAVVRESIQLSGLGSSMNQRQPSDLRQVERTLLVASESDSSVADEVKHIRYTVIAAALQTADSRQRQHRLAVAQYRILLLAGLLGFVPQGR